MDILQNILAFIVALGILVTIHEYGHFWVARRCGVKVLRFSVGFGKALYSRYDRHGTEYVIAAIPLGGYVKMLDEREAEVPDELKDQAFNGKPLGQRMAIVAAGPAVNLLFAVFAYWLMFMSGYTTSTPVLGEPLMTSPAAQAQVQSGQEIVRVDGKAVQGWDEVNLALVSRLGESGVIDLDTRHVQSGQAVSYRVPISNWSLADEQSPMQSLGLLPYRIPAPAVLGQIVEGGRAEQAGLREGDRILSVNGETVSDWRDLVQQVQSHPEQVLDVRFERDGQMLNYLLRPEAAEVNGVTVGRMGAWNQPVEVPEFLQRKIQYGPFEAVAVAADKTVQMIGLTLESIWKMIHGAISVKNLSGPITIAKVAGASAESGLENFLYFLAYLSVSLGVLNLLPIPMLDGGHLLFYLAEAIRGKPVSEAIQLAGIKIGMALLVTFMLLATFNDLARL